MSGAEAGLGRTASELKRAFDQSFAELPGTGEQQVRDFLAIRVGADGYAIDLAEVAGLFADKPVTRLPNAAPEFLGIAGFRGIVIPVYDLRVLLGYPAKEMPRWLVTAAAMPVAFAFDVFHRHLRISTQAVAKPEGADFTHQHVRQVLRAPDIARPIVDMASILTAIKNQAQYGAARKGQ
ncbi:MAG: cheW3-2 [Betaproteobacteria bacterium]|nr:cheW3-2 [Betaproteobacteria bacterium]